VGRRKKEKYVFKKQSYMRMLRYAAPYKKRLIIGIIAGFTVAGSMFSSFLLIPGIINGVVPAENRQEELNKQAEVLIAAVEDNIHKSKEDKVVAVVEIIKPDETIRIEDKVEEIKEKAAKFGIHLPVTYNHKTLTWDYLFTVNIILEDDQGKMHWQFFSIFVFAFIFLWGIKNFATYINRYCTRWVGTKVVTDLRNEIFKKLTGQSLNFYGKIDVGQLISRCTNDTAAIESAVANTIADATRCPLEILACASAIIYFSVKSNNFALPVILFLGLPLAVLPLIIIGRKIRKIYRKSFANIAIVVSRMHEIFTGILIVKAYHAEEREYEIFRKVNKRYFRTVVRALRAELLMSPSMEAVAVAATLIFLVYSYSQGVTLGTLAELLIPAFMAYQPIKKLAKIRTYAERSMAAADRYFDLIDQDTGIKEAANPIDINSFESEICFKDVEFSYGDTKIVDKLNLTIKKGEVVAVVGETGSGKTTIANLIARFYDVDAGTITIDGKDVRDLRISSLRDLIGIVTQDAILFNDTIASNIAYGCDNEPPMEDIIEAAKQANAHDFMVDGRHHDGYESMAGEKGNNFSGGEKQRISIARAIMKNPPIMILDEATSALDTVTERLVQDALDHLMDNRTVFAIAHRLSTIKHANQIIVLEKGKIIESGTHDELLVLNGKYRHLHDMQFGMQHSEDESKDEI